MKDGLDDRETAAVLAGLRMLQARRLGVVTIAGSDLEASIDDIETDGGGLEAMGADEIDDLCERLNQADVGA